MNQSINQSINVNNHKVLAPGANPEFFFGGAGELETSYSFVLIFNIMLPKSCHKYNSKPACDCIYVHEKCINTFCMTQSLNMN